MKVELIRIGAMEHHGRRIEKIASIEIRGPEAPEVIVWQGRYFVQYTQDMLGSFDYRETTGINTNVNPL